MAANTKAKKYTLTGGENTYSSPASVNESDARKLQSLIPSLSGELERERPKIALTTDAAFPSRVGAFWQFKHNNNGVIEFHWFCATATTLYRMASFPGGNWNAVPQVGVLADFPVFSNINNTLHMSDGVSNWIFDGSAWVRDGLPIPLRPPTFVVPVPVSAAAISSISRTNGIATVIFASNTLAAVLSINPSSSVTIAGVTDPTFNVTTQISTKTGAGPFTITFQQLGLPDAAIILASGNISQSSFSVTSNRYYWTTFTDQTPSHPHESSSSPRSIGTGAFNGKVTGVFLRPGTIISAVLGSLAVVGSGTDFSSSDVGLLLRGGGFVLGTVASVQDSQHLTLTVGSTATVGPGIAFTLLPSRATHWNLYASSSEEDKLGNFLASIPVDVSFYYDQSPMIGTVGAYFQGVSRPLLNDPTQPATIMEVHKNRIWRNLLPFPNFFTYTGYEEILAEQAGTPSECVPGTDPKTVSPSNINETSYPDQSSVITGIRKHGDALFIGTELNVIPLYGSSLADFQLSEAQAFAVGFAGRRASCSTPFGLAFVSYDLKVYLYPSQYSFGVDSTTALVELGRPKRPEFENIDGADFPNVHLIFYNWGRRNWLVLSYRRTDQTFATWVFDFEVKGWFQLQTGYTAITVFEMTLGRKSLIGAGTDNKVYVIDDRTGNFPVPGGAIYPVGYFRVLLDYSDPGSNFVNQNIEFEKSNKDMSVDVTVWLDPVDPENPGVGIPIEMSKKKIGANVYSGRPSSLTGGTCQRVLIEFAVAAGPQNGTFRGYTSEAEKIESPVL